MLIFVPNQLTKAMNIEIGTKNQAFATIGRTEDFKPVLWFKIGQLKQARTDLANYFNTFNEVMETGIHFDEVEYLKFSDQFYQQAVKQADEVIQRIFENETMYKDKFFTFLPKRVKNVWSYKY